MIKYYCDICGKENAFTIVLNRKQREYIFNNYGIIVDPKFSQIEACEEHIKEFHKYYY